MFKLEEYDKQKTNKQSSVCRLLLAGFLLGLLFDLAHGYVSPKRRAFSELHGDAS
jgi:hypothetical protein